MWGPAGDMGSGQGHRTSELSLSIGDGLTSKDAVPHILVQQVGQTQ